MPNICDICGKEVSSADTTIVKPEVIVNATQSGYVPSHLPGVEDVSDTDIKKMGWEFVVSGNSQVDWGLCSACKRELENFNRSVPIKSKKWWQFWI